MEPNKQVLKNSGTYFVEGKEFLKHKKTGNAQIFNDALQIRHAGSSDSDYKTRTQVIKFIVTEDTCMARGKAKKNTVFGKGGGEQIVLDPIDQKNVRNAGLIMEI